MAIGKGKKRVQVTVDSKAFDELRELGRAAGFRDGWLSVEFDRMVRALHSVVLQAVQDAQDKQEMTEDQAKKRYEALMRPELGENQLDLFEK